MFILNYSQKTMLKVIKQQPGISKPALMKLLFILQNSYGLALGYRFGLYTYGPYAQDVINDLDTLIYTGLIQSKCMDNENFSGHALSVNEVHEDIGGGLLDCCPEDDAIIREALALFGNKTAKALELEATIIYISCQYRRNGWEESTDELLENVHAIKPHFDLADIKEAYNGLSAHKIFA